MGECEPIASIAHIERGILLCIFDSQAKKITLTLDHQSEFSRLPCGGGTRRPLGGREGHPEA